MSAIGDWAAMGPHGAFVWASYAVALIVLGVLSGYVLWRYRASLRDLERLQRGLGRRDSAAR